jgi:hypothetical protein
MKRDRDQGSAEGSAHQWAGDAWSTAGMGYGESGERAEKQTLVLC